MDGVVMTNEIVALVVMVTLMALFIAFSYWFFPRVRNGRNDLRNNPLYRAPPSPHSLLDHRNNMGRHLDGDETVGNPPEDWTRGL
jgi:hypothetical protein